MGLGVWAPEFAVEGVGVSAYKGMQLDLCSGFGVRVLGFGVWGLGFGVWGLGFRGLDLGFKGWGLACFSCAHSS